ncbi:hypothetical protein [Microvirga zambiensis]|uniref:hypothetical protein n=1 Tax=Microvirga zambiensis TaxID=1402137 RepID=UPI00191E5663|nr:hypothetical protein [Microvirga zambiensis]
MTSTTDFELWLELGNEPETHDESYSLYRASHGESFAAYTVTDDGGKRFVKGPSGDTLALVSEQAIQAFQKHIERFNPDPDLGWEGMIAYRSAMAKED